MIFLHQSVDKSWVAESVWYNVWNLLFCEKIPSQLSCMHTLHIKLPTFTSFSDTSWTAWEFSVPQYFLHWLFTKSVTWAVLYERELYFLPTHIEEPKEVVPGCCEHCNRPLSSIKQNILSSRVTDNFSSETFLWSWMFQRSHFVQFFIYGFSDAVSHCLKWRRLWAMSNWMRRSVCYG